MGDGGLHFLGSDSQNIMDHCMFSTNCNICYFGNIYFLYYRVLREAVNDASDLVQKRRKAPHTHLDIWKVAKIGSLPCTFMDPLITCRSYIHSSLGAIIDVNFSGNSVVSVSSYFDR